MHRATSYEQTRKEVQTAYEYFSTNVSAGSVLGSILKSRLNGLIVNARSVVTMAACGAEDLAFMSDLPCADANAGNVRWDGR
jgi:hypothetical protein